MINMGDFVGDSIPNYVQAFWDKLQELNCPVIKSLGPWNGVEALLKPGELRLKFLQWVIAGIDENLADTLDSIGVRNDNKDLKATKILKIFSQLKLCAPDDTALITGRVPKPQQLSFLNILLNLLMARKRVEEENVQEANASETSSLSSDATFVMCPATSTLFTKNFIRHTQFIDNIASKRLFNVFQERVLRVPPDIEMELEQQGITQPEGHKKMSVVMQVEILKKKLQSLEWDYFHQEEFLVKHSDFFNSGEHSSVPTALENLSATIDEILLMENEFDRVFNDHLLPSCGRKENESQISSLGEEMSHLYELMQEVEKIFAATKELRKSYEVFQTTLKDSTTDLNKEENYPHTMRNVDEWLRILKVSLANLTEKCFSYNVARTMVEKCFDV